MAGFGKPIEPQLSDDQRAAEKAAQAKRFSKLLEELFGLKDQKKFQSFTFPEDIKTNLTDVFDSYNVEAVTKGKFRRSLSEIVVTSTASENCHIHITKNSVIADMSQMDLAGKTKAALEMAMIAANNPKLMDDKDSIPLQGTAEEKFALYLAAQKFGFDKKLDPKSLQGLEKLAPEKQQEIAEAIDASWAQAKKSLAQFAANDENTAESESAAETEQDAEKPETGEAGYKASPEPLAGLQPAQTSKPAEEPHIKGQFNDIVNDPRYRMAVDYAAENGTISRSKLESHVRENGQAIGSSTISKIFNMMEEQGLLSAPGPRGRQYIGHAEDISGKPQKAEIRHGENEQRKEAGEAPALASWGRLTPQNA